ncbi:hypothetical protein ATN84_21790 [Paramesorhizobium deserti]|uniref:EF-hand domain-containing protein n=1 Tax=Paramesorhizobium deserti TaxID=1494590 RepID=A0A135HNR9_9HYPH|nr:hypothetical protein [Paramesorhizobium deserti]KXF74862.1 hypothetical protein ATN84_21790 [Paramesorhizobium deserti]
MKSIIATMVSALLVCTGAAMAQEAMYKGQQDHIDADKSGEVSRQEYQAFMTNAFGKLDADKNGSLSQAETANILTADQFAATDANGDGRVSKDELMNRVMQDFSAADKNGDGSLQ